MTADTQGLLRALIGGALPNEHGFFGPFGGRFVPETLVPALDRFEAGARDALADAAFHNELRQHQETWVGRPTPLMYAPRLSEAWKAQVWLKREDLAHTGAHKINNALGQALIAKRIGAERIVAETGAGQHGVATAAACARVGLPCIVYMGAKDVERQAPNVVRMRRMGAEVRPVTTGDATLRSAVDEAIRHWVGDPQGTHYILGSAVGPHPFPWVVREFQKVIGIESRRQMLEQVHGLPDLAVACVGGGSNAIGFYHGFLGDSSVEMHGAEAGGVGAAVGQHAATMSGGTPGVLHGSRSMLLQDEDGQVSDTQSVSAGLDYPAIGPEHALLAHVGRVRYHAVRDGEAIAALDELSRLEGILPAVEPAHALALAKRLCEGRDHPTVLVNVCGRGDKDMPILTRLAEQEGR
ncbi:MAG: tryptophan synthase subunit beta [Phycisphaerales bacterium]|jgi:tryptophan synthase beta chain